MKKQKKIPKFKNEEEMAKFWDTHSPLDYPGEFTEVKNIKFCREPLEKVAGRKRPRTKNNETKRKDYLKNK